MNHPLMVFGGALPPTETAFPSQTVVYARLTIKAATSALAMLLVKTKWCVRRGKHRV